jgi:ATP-dependent DNA helicase RecQ
VRLLGYFGEQSEPCGNCDNCLTPPETWDATLAAQKVLSCVYRFYQHGQNRFGAGHLIDVLRGKETEKVRDYVHQNLSTFGIGQDLSEAEWRAVIRQLIALGHLMAEGDFHTLGFTPSSRAVLKGEVALRVRKASERPRREKRKRASKSAAARQAEALPAALDGDAQARFEALRAFRAEVARERNLPAYVVFHDATLREIARARPASLAALGKVNGVGERKLEAYGQDILRIMAELS